MNTIVHFEDMAILQKAFATGVLESLRMKMQRGVDEFKIKAPHRKDFIDATEKGIEDLLEVSIFVENIFHEWEAEIRYSRDESLKNLKLIQDNYELKQEVEKLKNILKFN